MITCTQIYTWPTYRSLSVSDKSNRQKMRSLAIDSTNAKFKAKFNWGWNPFLCFPFDDAPNLSFLAKLSVSVYIYIHIYIQKITETKFSPFEKFDINLVGNFPRQKVSSLSVTHTVNTEYTRVDVRTFTHSKH